MLQLVAGAVPEVIKLIKDAATNPETYEALEALRQMIEKLTGREIDKNGFVALMEGVTQGEPYTGRWEEIDPDDHESGRRLRVNGGYFYDIGRGNLAFNPDK
jgi:hypothetical protein